jgi:translation initiation factor 5B
MTGFDASGHIAEETKNARFVLLSPRVHRVTSHLRNSVVAGKGILSSAIATGIFGFATTILFLFCTPNLEMLFSLMAPQPFVQIYALALGKPGSVVMTVFAVLGLILVGARYFSPKLNLCLGMT